MFVNLYFSNREKMEGEGIFGGLCIMNIIYFVYLINYSLDILKNKLISLIRDKKIQKMKRGIL